MIILVVNCGSSSLKYTLFHNDEELGSGLIEKIGTAKSVYSRVCKNVKQNSATLAVADHTQAIRLMMEAFIEDELIETYKDIDAVGHRVVHGGPLYKGSALVDKKVLQNKIGRALAPLHQVNYIGIEACLKFLKKTPQVAVFDTAFHQTMPAQAYTYALPYKLTQKYNIRKYGFHGTSHQYVAQRAAQLLKKPKSKTNVITLHLGNGSSISAVKNGQCVDTSMGLTPLSGVVMGSRCGDIDPAIVTFLMERENLSPAEIDKIMNKESGVLGLSGISNDMREVIVQANKGNERAKLAIDSFVYNIKKYIGSYHAVVGGAQAIVFTAGIGERSPLLRKSICKGLEGIGIQLDLKKNQQTISKEMFIHAKNSKVKILVIPTQEEWMIAQETKRIVKKRN